RLARPNFGVHALLYSRKRSNRQVDLDKQRIDLGNFHNFGLLKDILSGRHEALDHVAVDRAGDYALSQQGGSPLHLEYGKFLLRLRLTKLKDGLLQLAQRLIELRCGCDRFAMQLGNAIRLLFQKTGTLPTKFDKRCSVRACLGEIQGRLLEIGAQPGYDHTLTHAVAPVDRQLFQDARGWAAEFGRNKWLDDAVLRRA